ncbi:hypothetical protein [Blastopirellula retiformator]|uniref:hypothetical protein n=1 Tax=Blastopirellula retiformator TaxID=2527970 RepID=UPI0011B46740|nr:hypothetical protein [Blastopirellula retiformator]
MTITKFLVDQRDYVTSQRDLDYLTMPQHFRSVEQSTVARLFLHYNPYLPNWKVSTQVWKAVDENPAFRWNRKFFTDSLRILVTEGEVTEFRLDVLRDTWEQSFADTMGIDDFLSEMDSLETRKFVTQTSVIRGCKLWEITGVPHLFLRKQFVEGKKECTRAEYVWIDSAGEARRLKTPATHHGNGIIEYLL